jgi:uncharacterized membrane protein YfcA
MAAVLAVSLGAAASYSTNKVNQEKDLTCKEDLVFGIMPPFVGNVDVVAALCIVASSALLAPVGAKAAKLVKDVYLRRAQGIFMMCVGPTILLRDALRHREANERREENVATALTHSNVFKLATIGIFSGFTAGFFGVGGGAVVVPALSIVMNQDYKTALGTSMAGLNCIKFLEFLILAICVSL